jgi:hypothetical protein
VRLELTVRFIQFTSSVHLVEVIMTPCQMMNFVVPIWKNDQSNDSTEINFTNKLHLLSVNHQTTMSATAKKTDKIFYSPFFAVNYCEKLAPTTRERSNPLLESDFIISLVVGENSASLCTVSLLTTATILSPTFFKVLL